MTTKPLNRWVIRATGGVIAVAWLLSLVAQACDTPVYLYSLQNWRRDPYQVFCFYREAVAEKEAEVNRYFDRVSSGLQAHANLRFDRIDVNRLKSDQGDPFLQRLWARHQADPLPFYAILTPKGKEMFVGQLDLATAKALVGSPKRKQLAQQLGQGKQGLLLLLQGTNPSENAAAEKVVRQALAQVEERGGDVGFLTVARKDPQERWLVQQLLQVEDDLKDFDNAMVFAVFGRGYVMPPCLGKGITEANAIGLMEFMSGPCTCEIKATNAGLDLLTDWDWDAHIPDAPIYPERPLNSLLFDVSEAPTAATETPVPPPGVKAAHPSPPLTKGGAAGVSSAPETPPSQPPPQEALPSRRSKAEQHALAEPSKAEQVASTPLTLSPGKGEVKKGEAKSTDAKPKPDTPPLSRPKAQETPGPPPAIPVIPAPPGAFAARPKPDASPAQAEGSALSEAEGKKKDVGRVPALLTSTELNQTPSTAEGEGPAFASVLAQRLGLALGGGLVLVVAVGLVLFKRRKAD